VQATLNQFAGVADALLRKATPADVPAFIADLKQVEEVRGSTSQQSEARALVAAVRAGHSGNATDWDGPAQDADLDELRESFGGGGRTGPLPAGSDELIQQATGMPPPGARAAPGTRQYEQALHNVKFRFEAPGPVLDGRPLREHGPDEVLDHQAKLREQVGALADWVNGGTCRSAFYTWASSSVLDRLIEATCARAGSGRFPSSRSGPLGRRPFFSRTMRWPASGARNTAGESRNSGSWTGRLLQLGAARIMARRGGAPAREDDAR